VDRFSNSIADNGRQLGAGAAFTPGLSGYSLNRAKPIFKV